MEIILDHMRGNENSLMVLFTAGIFLSGIASLIVAIHLARDNRALRKAGTEPMVIGYLKPDRTTVNVIRFHIRNVGKGPAFNVSMEILGEKEMYRERGLRLPFEPQRPPITALPQDDDLGFFFGVGHELLGDPSLPPVTISISYENASGRVFNENSAVDIRQFEGFSWVGRLAEDEIAKTLNKIERTIGHMASGFKMLHVKSASPDEWRREKEKEYQELEKFMEENTDTQEQN